MEEEKASAAQSLIDVVNEIAAISDYRITVKKLCYNLARRLKLLVPMFEEIRESNEPISEDTLKTLMNLKEAMCSAKDYLKFCSQGSKIYLVRFFFDLLASMIRSVWSLRIFVLVDELVFSWNERATCFVLLW